MNLKFDYRFAPWPPVATPAAGYFYGEIMPDILDALEGEGMWKDLPPMSGHVEAITLIFPRADHTHRAWRLAAIQTLARDVAPRRVNAVVGDDDEAIRETIAYLAAAPGVTGQLLEVDGNPPAKG